MVAFLGSDDQLRLWVNGELVHESSIARIGVAGQDRVPVRLRKGWNRLLAKVRNETSEYDLHLRLAADPLLIGGLYADRGQWARAEPHLQRALKLEPRNPQHWRDHGRCLAGLSRFPEAANAFLEALKQMPANANPANLNASIASLDEVFARIIKQRSEDWPLWRARSQHLAGRKRWREAIAVCDNLIAAGMKDGAVFRSRADAHYHLEEWQKAADDCTRVLALKPRDRDALEMRDALLVLAPA